MPVIELPTLEAWSAAVAALLATAQVVNGVTVHDTDPPETFFSPRIARPGPLPVLVEESALEDESVEVHSHEGPLAEGIMEAIARIAVLDARRIQCERIALRAPRQTNGSITFDVVLALE